MPTPMIAGGTITPMSFVKLSTTADAKCLLAGAGDKIAGVSQRGTRNTPYPSLDDGNAALVGESLQVFQDMERCLITVGTSAVVAGDYLKSDGSGFATTASSGDEAGGQAMEKGAAGQIIEMMVRIRKA